MYTVRDFVKTAPELADTLKKINEIGYRAVQISAVGAMNGERPEVSATQARRMLEFLGLPWDPACLAFHETKRPVKTASVNQVRQPVYRSSAGRWRAHAARLGPLLATLGVAPP